jgi:hypothetical protein
LICNHSSNDILGNELEAVGTEFAASADSQAAFGTLFNGDRWMIFTNSLTGVLHWDYVSAQCCSFLGRFFNNLPHSLPSVASLPSPWPIRSENIALNARLTLSYYFTRASSSILTNLSAVGELGRQWQSKPLIDFESNLSTNVTHANAGGLQGNHMFYTSDYMVSTIFQIG